MTGGPTVASPRPVVFHGETLVVRDGRPSPWRPHPAVAAGLVLMALAFLLDVTPSTVVAIGVGTILGIQTTVAVDRGRRVAEDLARPLSARQVACAVADGLHAAGLSPRGAAAVRSDGERHVLDGVAAPVAEVFSMALAETVRAMASPTTPAVSRWVLDPPVDNAHGLQVALHRLRPDRRAWHAVPVALTTTQQHTDAFARAWDHWVGGGSPAPAGRLDARAAGP